MPLRDHWWCILVAKYGVFLFTEIGAFVFTDYTNSQFKFLFAIEVNQKLVGGIEIQFLTENYLNNGELGFWLGEAYWGQGIAKSAIVQITDKAFAETHITRIIAKTFGENIASQNLLLKCGFSKEAEFKDALLKDGKIYDEYVFTLKRKNH